MSLLMDALKKAELAKRKTQRDNASAPAATSEPPSARGERAAPEPSAFEPQAHAIAPTAVPAADRPHSPSSLPSLPDRLELLDDEFAVTPAAKAAERQTAQPAAPASAASEGRYALQDVEPPARPPARTAKTTATPDSAVQREAIQNLFETKQAPASRKSFGIVVGVASAVAIAAIGGYFWYQLQPKSGFLVGAGPDAGRPPPAPDIPAPPPAAAVIPGLAAPTASAAEDDAEAEREIVRPRPAKPPATVPERKLFQVSKPAAPLLDPALERGYAALSQGDADAAKAAYEQALGNDPRNVDALAGLAVLAQNSGDPEQAADYYLRILEADPRHAFALAGLIGLQARMNPAEAETRLKQALSVQPDSAALNFGLGNLYASAKRWPEAQQAYFKAAAADPGNPDYLFNLAVSLDQLRQPRLAADYYAQAIAAAGNRPGNFDRTKASERLQQLRQ